VTIDVPLCFRRCRTSDQFQIALFPRIIIARDDEWGLVFPGTALWESQTAVADREWQKNKAVVKVAKRSTSFRGPGLSVDIAMTLSLTRPYPDPTRCRVGSDPFRVPVGSSWAGSMSSLVRLGYFIGSGK
jgi:hypothetical protein